MKLKLFPYLWHSHDWWRTDDNWRRRECSKCGCVQYLELRQWITVQEKPQLTHPAS